MLPADKGYAHDPIRRTFRRRRIPQTIPERVDQVACLAAKGGAGGRPPDFNEQLYRQGNVVRAALQSTQPVERPDNPLRETGQHLPFHTAAAIQR